MNDILDTKEIGTLRRVKPMKIKGSVEKTPSKFFDGVTLFLCVGALIGSSAYGFRMALGTLSIVGEIWSWALTVVAVYLILYTIVKLRYVIK
jgi:hypothetical protein